MADYERMVLDHYQLSTPYPTEWPVEKDQSDVSDEEEEETFAQKAANRKSRFAALERSTGDRRRSLVPGSQKTRDGVENLVQRDEPDPLGTSESVVRVLRQQGLPVQDDARLRNRFLLSSTTFSPAMFLSQVHATATTQDLLQGLDVLSQSIDQKSASLKVLVESNFERFVRAKMTIDNVYKEMKGRGADEVPAPSPGHARQASRGSFRRSIGGNLPIIQPESKRKNALTKESDYGVLGIRVPLIDVSAKAEEVWGPALGGREREESLKALAVHIDAFRDCYELAGLIADSIKRKDYEALVEEYAKAKQYSDEAKRSIETAQVRKKPLTDREVQKILIVARMWYDVESQLKEFERDVWKRLSTIQGNVPNEPQDQHLELIGILLELGVEENPIWVWLQSRYENLKTRIQLASDRTRAEIEVLRRRLANTGKPPPHKVAAYLRSLKRHDLAERPTSMDSPEVIELWERMHTFLNGLLSSQGALGEVMDFWQTAQGFVEGKTQKTLPVGFNGESQRHHALSPESIEELKTGTAELVDSIRETVHGFFLESPLDDISAIFSPIPPTPLTPRSASLTPSALRDPRFAFDSQNKPPPSPRSGEPWEKFAFWPPYSTSVSAVHYLSKLLVLVGDGASEMATISPMDNADGMVESLRTLVSGSRERCVTAICAAWTKDAENIKVLEDWKRSADNKELTRMPTNFSAFETVILTGMQKVVYISEATKARAAEVILPPPTKLLQTVRSQFVTTLYKALSGMVENAERLTQQTGDEWATDPDDVTSPTVISFNTQFPGVIGGVERNVRMLLTLSNLQSLRTNVVPNLTTQFENAFSVKLTEESKTIRDVLGQIDARLFQSYTRPAVETLHSIISTGIEAADWPPGPNVKPREVRPYVYEALLSLVLIHSQVSTTAASLTNQVLSYLLEQASRELLEGFRKRAKYNLSSLMQATLDVEFVAQTLSQYTTDRAGEIQGQIYQELDKGTDNDARTKLQTELPEMRAVLKRLRENSRSEFACFKKPRRPQTQQ